MLVATLIEKITGKRLVDFNVKSLLGKISGFLLAIYIFFKIFDTWAWANGLLPKMGFSFDEMFNQEAGYSKWLLWMEIGVCGILPAIMLIVPKIRNIAPLLYTASILTCAGVILNRFVFTVQNLAIPVMPFDNWYTYVPNWTEWWTSFMVVAFSAIVVSLAYRYLPLFPQENKLNS